MFMNLEHVRNLFKFDFVPKVEKVSVAQNKYSVGMFGLSGMFFLKSNSGTLIHRLRAILLAAGVFFTITIHAQTSAEVFGQNRVQYKDFVFSYYESDNFTTYFYQGGQDIGKFVVKTAEDQAEEIAKLLDFKYRRKIDIIVYNNINELNQTNIGIYEAGQNPGGTTKIPDGKMFVYFNGDHRHLIQQIREGIAKIYIDKMMLGSNFAELIQNAVLLNLPDWYKLGLVEYIGKDWNSDMEDRLRDGILSGRFKKLNKLQPSDAVFVGHSIWHYIEETHGKSSVTNINYLTRVNRSVDNGFLFVLGTNLQQTLQDWYAYYFNRFTAEKSTSAQPESSTWVKRKVRKGFDYYQAKLSPDGKTIAYASNDMGRYKAIIQNTETNKSKVVLRGGFRTNTIFTDQSIPLLAWDPIGKKLAVIKDKRSQIFLYLYDLETGKKEVNPIRKFQKVVSFGFAGDSKTLVLSAIQNGQTDVYLYTLASTTTRKITNDYFDDLYPAYIQADSMRGIMFSSNRDDEELAEWRYESQNIKTTLDLFFYDLGKNSLHRVTNTPFADETYPQNFSDSSFCFLSEENGVRNRYIGHFETVFDHNNKKYRFIDNEYKELDSVVVRENVWLDSALDLSAVTLRDSSIIPVYKIAGVTAAFSNYTYNIREQSVVPEKNLALDVFQRRGKLQFYKYALKGNPDKGAGKSTEYIMQLQRKAIEQTKQNSVDKSGLSEPKIKIDTSRASRGNRPFDFQSEFDYGVKLFDWDSASASKLAEAAKGGYIFRFSKVRPYFVRFSVDKTITQIDNNILMTRYQPFDPYVPQFNNAPVSFMFKFGISDLLENHKVYGGLRLPFVGIDNSSEYFITYENLTKRLDKKVSFYRRSVGSRAYDRLPFTSITLPGNYYVDYSIKTNYLELELKYPINVLNSIRFGLAFRNDVVVYKAQDEFSLKLPNVSDNWLFARAEYVFDNTMEVMTNIRYGTKFKVFAEFHKQFPTKNKILFDRVDFPVVQFNNALLGVFGFDARHYQKVAKQIIWATRISGGLSVGTRKMIYYLGGLDNWITSPGADKFDRTTPINTNNNYAFQTLATPLRGFKQNARNGNKFLLLNTELRIPIFSALIRQPIKSELIRNFQIVPFIDAGTAWEGLSPFSDNNPLFSETLPNTPTDPSVIIRLKRYKTPVVMGFGSGLRTSFLGYFLRFDAAWSLDTGEVSKKPMYYFTFGLDF
jgi:hypothetical protein